MGTYVVQHIWRSEDSYEKSVGTRPLPGLQGLNQGHQACVASAFTFIASIMAQGNTDIVCSIITQFPLPFGLIPFFFLSIGWTCSTIGGYVTSRRLTFSFVNTRFSESWNCHSKEE